MPYGSWMMPLRVDLVIVACAISAGVHAALAPEPFREAAPAGLGFAVSAALLGALVVALTVRPGSRLALTSAAAVLVGLVASWVFAVTTGVPVLHPDVEPVDGLALVTKAIELAGLIAASALLWRPPTAALIPRMKGA